MYKLTCFAPIEPKQLELALKGITFKTVKNGFEWKMDGATFRIEPFQNQPRDSMKAYRVLYDGSDIHGGAYLFDLSLGCMGGIVTAVEYTMEHPTMKHQDWMKDLRKRKSYQMIDARGLFMKQGIGIVVVDNSITVQLRSRKNQKLILVEALRKVDFIREELCPVEYDLFSCSLVEETA
jgi:hypothetical protein